MPLRVLITNAWLSTRSGSELYASELAGALQARGHRPVLYAPMLGRLAEELRARTIPVVQDLTAMTEAPDIIHGHHNHQLMTALMRFPHVPAIRVCHGWLDERPQQFPRILRFVPVDDTVRDRLVSEWAVEPSQIEVLLNFVDLNKFQRRPKLPAKPTRALVFSNGARAHLNAIRRVCEAQGIAAVDALGASVGHVAEAPHSVLGRYDLVFAKARCALEAMAVGTAVVLCDEAGMGPLVSPANFDRLRQLNFGIRTLRDDVSDNRLAEAIAQYDPNDAAEVSRMLRETASVEDTADAFLKLYDDVIAEWRATPTRAFDEECHAISNYLRELESRQTLEAHTHGALRDIYERATAVPGLRWLLPTRRVARQLGRRLRRS